MANEGKEFRQIDTINAVIDENFGTYIIVAQEPVEPYKTVSLTVEQLKEYTSLAVAGLQYYPASILSPIPSLDKVNWIWPRTDENGKVLNLYIPDFATQFWVSKDLYTYSGYDRHLSSNENVLVSPYVDDISALMIERICSCARIEAGTFPINSGWKATLRHDVHSSWVFNQSFESNFFDSIAWVSNQSEEKIKTDPTYVNYWVQDIHQILDATGGFPLTEIVYTKDPGVPNLSLAYTIHYRLVWDRFRED